MAVSRATHNIARRQQQGFISSSDRDGSLHHHGATTAHQGSSSSSSLSSAPINLNINDDSSGISTSGQVDEGQFRLVPNAPEDDSYNKRHPPRQSANRHNSVYDNPQPGPSRHWGNSNNGQHREAVASITPAMPSVVNTLKAQQGSFSEQNYNQDNVSQGSNGNGNGTEQLSQQQQPEESDNSPANNSNNNNNLDGLLPCPTAEDLQLEPQLSSSFMDSSNFGHPVDLEDIQLQKFIPEQQQRPQEPTSNGLPQLQREAVAGSSSSSGINNQHSSILESMTGPLSKRLRTLHNLQQMQSNPPAPPSQPSSSSNQQEAVQDTTAKKPANKDEASSSGIPPNSQQQSDSSDSNHSNGDGNGGPTTHTYSVTIEQQVLPPSIIMKPKRMFEQKMWGGQDKGVLSEPESRIGDSSKNLDETMRSGKTASGSVELDPTLTISDAPVQSRAKATLPASHLAIKPIPNQEGQVGVFAKKRIPKGCRFGPMEGVLRESNARTGRKDDEMVLVIIAGEQMSVLDTTDDGEWFVLFHRTIVIYTCLSSSQIRPIG